jgi:hypothetical protein
MNKHIYLVYGSANEDYTSFTNRISRLASQVGLDVLVNRIKYTITTAPPPPLSIIPFSRKKIACISVYSPALNPLPVLLASEGLSGVFNVKEALPVSYRKEWEDGSPTPGACLLTLFAKKKNIDYTLFLDRWHNRHTPLSLRYHPLWNYNRNVIEERLTLNTPTFDGIVEEQVRKASDLLNPFRFFGNPLLIIPRMIHVYTDTKSFIDYTSMETYLTTEYILKS